MVVNKLKAAEGVDLYDLDTDFSPFASSKPG
ncbi:MAG: VUT or ECF family vitamin uptake transporter [Porphyrobacter sp. HL-46]|nr:MAG: VUT or ECF family vitamin uptake transporter [Porphyrobacter sp. HL-46]